MGASRENCPDCGKPMFATYYRDYTDKFRLKRLGMRRFYCPQCKREWKLHPVD